MAHGQTHLRLGSRVQNQRQASMRRGDPSTHSCPSGLPPSSQRQRHAETVIHLASVMQFVGFRSAIGTMWAMDDSESKKITPTFYKHMVDDSDRLDHTRMAFALNLDDEICANTTRSADPLYPSQCLVLVYPCLLSRFAPLVLTICCRNTRLSISINTERRPSPFVWSICG